MRCKTENQFNNIIDNKNDKIGKSMGKLNEFVTAVLAQTL